MTTKEKEIISEEELASKFALALKAAVQECANRIYPLYEQEYKFLKQKYPVAEDYYRELKKYYGEKIAFREKHVGPFGFDVEKYLTDKILTIGLKGFEDEGGTYFEHDKIRQLLGLYSKSLDVKYKYHYQPANESFGKVEVVAYAKGGDSLKEISFEFEYLSDTLTEAALLLVADRLITLVGRKLTETASSRHTDINEGIERINNTPQAISDISKDESSMRKTTSCFTWNEDNYPEKNEVLNVIKEGLDANKFIDKTSPSTFKSLFNGQRSSTAKLVNWRGPSAKSKMLYFVQLLSERPELIENPNYKYAIISNCFTIASKNIDTKNDAEMSSMRTLSTQIKGRAYREGRKPTWMTKMEQIFAKAKASKKD